MNLQYAQLSQSHSKDSCRILAIFSHNPQIMATVFEAIPAHHRPAAARAHPCGESRPWKKRLWLLWLGVSPPWQTCVALPGACFAPMVWRCHSDSTLAPGAPGVGMELECCLGEVHRSFRPYMALQLSVTGIETLKHV